MHMARLLFVIRLENGKTDRKRRRDLVGGKTML
jgi:hypothetical protein